MIQKKKSPKILAFDRRIIDSYTKSDGKKKYIILMNYNHFMMELKKIRNKYRNNDPEQTFHSPTIDFAKLQKNNWRTAFKLSSMCAICASNENLEMHHIKHIKKKSPKGKLYKGFDQVVASLCRKQICVCKLCHYKIHKGLYDKIALKDLIDVRIVAPESFLEADLLDLDKGKPYKPKDKVYIDEINKTYFNPELQEYYKTGNNFTVES